MRSIILNIGLLYLSVLGGITTAFPTIATEVSRPQLGQRADNHAQLSKSGPLIDRDDIVDTRPSSIDDRSLQKREISTPWLIKSFKITESIKLGGKPVYQWDFRFRRIQDGGDFKVEGQIVVSGGVGVNPLISAFATTKGDSRVILSGRAHNGLPLLVQFDGVLAGSSTQTTYRIYKESVKITYGRVIVGWHWRLD